MTPMTPMFEALMSRVAAQERDTKLWIERVADMALHVSSLENRVKLIETELKVISYRTTAQDVVALSQQVANLTQELSALRDYLTPPEGQ